MTTSLGYDKSCDKIRGSRKIHERISHSVKAAGNRVSVRRVRHRDSVDVVVGYDYGYGYR